jgi:hypothetical protein
MIFSSHFQHHISVLSVTSDLLPQYSNFSPIPSCAPYVALY